MFTGQIPVPSPEAQGFKIPLLSPSDGRPAVADWLDANLPGMVETYKRLHSNPELAFQEFKTSALVAAALNGSGWRVATGIGKTGVAGVLENGKGPTVLIRGDTDALPVEEKTGLPYASKIRVKRTDGSVVGVMHACGHDAHTSMVIGLGALLAELREHWRGTVVLVAQPAEETGNGAKAMIDDGLFEAAALRPEICLS